MICNPFSDTNTTLLYDLARKLEAFPELDFQMVFRQHSSDAWNQLWKKSLNLASYQPLQSGNQSPHNLKQTLISNPTWTITPEDPLITFICNNQEELKIFRSMPLDP